MTVPEEETNDKLSVASSMADTIPPPEGIEENRAVPMIDAALDKGPNVKVFSV